MRIILSTVLVAALSMGTLYADKPSHAGKGKHEKKHKKHKFKKKHSQKHFSMGDDAVIRAHFSTLPRGLVKKLRRGGELPEGWKKKVRVGQPIPQEYLRYAEPMPYRLQSQLSVGPVGSKVLQIADKVIRVETGTNMILDAIDF